MMNRIVLCLLALFTAPAFAGTSESIGQQVVGWMGYLWLWCAGWYLGVVIFLVALALSGNNYRTVTGSSYSAQSGLSFHTFSVPVANPQSDMVNPAETLLPRLWVVVYPLATLYWPVYTHAHQIALTGQPHLDWKLLKVVFPVVSLVLLRWLIPRIEDSHRPFCLALVKYWRFLFLKLARYYVLGVPATLLAISSMVWLFGK